MLYHCILTDGEQGEVVTDIEAADDADALLRSESLLADGDHASLEIWFENRIVGYRSQADSIANNVHELCILVACLLGIVAFFALTMAIVLDAI